MKATMLPRYQNRGKVVSAASTIHKPNSARIPPNRMSSTGSSIGAAMNCSIVKNEGMVTPNCQPSSGRMSTTEGTSDNSLSTSQCTTFPSGSTTIDRKNRRPRLRIPSAQ